MSTHRVRVIDSHTGGEPTRLVIDGGPRLTGSMVERLTQFRQQHDAFRSAVVNEPRGSDVLVGALLMEPVDPANAAAVIFFNNVGFLGMCGHGTIGVIATLSWLERLAPGEHQVETPVGIVRNASRADESSRLTTLAALDPATVDMMTVVTVGNTATREIAGRMVTPRGYRWQEEAR